MEQKNYKRTAQIKRIDLYKTAFSVSGSEKSWSLTIWRSWLQSWSWSQHAGAASPRAIAVLGKGGGGFGGMPPEIFILREGFRQSFMCLLVISRGTFQALKQLIFHYFSLDTVYIIVVRMECFFVRGGSLSSILTTWRQIRNTGLGFIIICSIMVVGMGGGRGGSSSKSLLYVTFRHKRSFKWHCNTIKTL